ncbi:hypothetical protein [Bradyrhizobium sp. RDT46]|uniref:hypothetical protein n=1 Tax=Bradyrhizobium sp. RDT46 TaxID=3341829 RepID=UPI0035C6947A
MAETISLASVRRNRASYGWLTPLVVSLDATTSSYLKPSENKDPNHDPYQVEDNLEESSRLLDNCLAYRKEIYELQALATKTALEYELFAKQLEAQKTLEMNEGALKQLNAARPHYVNAVAATGDPILKGIANAHLATTNSSIEWEATRREAVTTKWTQLQQYQQALSSRHTDPGNALNYVERFNRVLALYKEDVIDAYNLARAAAAGIKILTSEANPDVPQLNDKDYLDRLVIWNRGAVKMYNEFRRDDCQSEITIPLKSLSKTNYAEHMKEDGPGELIVDLSDYFPPGMKHLRLKGVGVTFSTSAPETAALRFQQVAVLVVPPNTRDPFGSAPAENTIPRRPLLLEAMIGDKTSPVRYSSSVDLNNISPKGEWRVFVSKKMTVSDNGERPKRSETKVANVQLHLLVTSQNSLASNGFKDLQV